VDPEILHGRHNPMIDGAHGLHIWGWEVPVYLFLGGIVAGTMILLAAWELTTRERPRSRAAQLVPFLSAGLMGVGMLALLLDLEYPAHVYRFFMTFEPTSPMSWGSWLISLVFVVLVALGLGAMRDPLRERVRSLLSPVRGLVDTGFSLADRYRTPVLWASLGFGIGVGIYTGLLLGTMVARPMWNTALLGPLFLVSGISTGAATMLLLPLDPREQHLFVRLDVAAILAEIGLLLVMVISFATGGVASRSAAEGILGGPWTPWFWSFVFVGGLLVPLWLGTLEIRRNRPMTRIAPVLVLVGGFALRAIIVAAGQETSLSDLAMLP